MGALTTVTSTVIRCAFFLLFCLLGPFCKLRGLRKRRRCPPIGNQLLLQSATEIARKIRTREVSCEEVITAYVARCKEVNPLINAIVEDRFEAAVREAREIDIFLGSTTMDEASIASEKPLLGLPITVKESIAVQGMSNCVGVKDTPSRATRDADVVARVREAGGIPLLVSNTPEMCMWWHTFNKVTGTTRNPYDTRRTAGGSSGGEAALLGAGASLLGMGSDIAGSVRVPALFCGIFSHKPTPDWVSVEGHKPSATDENWSSFLTIGAMVRYATDLPLLLSAMAQSDNAKIGFNRSKKTSLKDMKFFYMDDIGSIATSRVNSDMRNAIYKLKKHLEDAYDVKVQKGNLKGMKKSFELSSGILLNIKNVYSAFDRTDDPKKSKSVLAEILRYILFMSPHSFPVIYYGILKRIGEAIPRSTYNNMLEKQAQLKKQFKELLGDNGVLIFPSFTCPAIYPQEITYNVGNFTYLMVFNMLGLPVTQCPLGYDKNQLPVGLQIVANPDCDHLTLALAQEIERTFGGWREPTQNKNSVSNEA
ncbi:fatty-acid amide hydrolase 2 [Ooceraea biroi]|uniref:fatty-acid amide hydrolase 2 n=1 Tax=Ooceraea biroi TaxID=2015173 RepID=UPI000F07870D|nr:fatty-acid amide hydrolase 2 [Ooceraea biroi]XP_011336495.2 fatty-acid amide hydrolase 2 [Ooceraea biroi]XP_019887039.2 fatty-acid amide hydrolase 2 [Ooceraea biroi]XP_019887040.2 fatty-acid amide hydrolase 2 [Ooceraea biroi]